MQFRQHYDIEGRHSFLSPSGYHWINYSEAKLRDTYANWMATVRGTELHELAAQCINLGIKLSHSKQTLNMYVNDAVGFRMKAEQPLYYSENSFGTYDAISFRDNFLRIHDLKTGKTKASMNQLKVYMALFCLEYSVPPDEIEAELRIYQNCEVFIEKPDPKEISFIMNKIVHFDNVILSMNVQDDLEIGT